MHQSFCFFGFGASEKIGIEDVVEKSWNHAAMTILGKLW